MNTDTQAFIRQHREDDVHRLALQLAGRQDAPAILRQIEGWQRLRRKVPAWAEADGLLYPARLALEQCSGEEAARYKHGIAQRLLPEGGAMADLTGGFGVDFAFMARHFARALYVERDAELCTLARHNMSLVGAAHAEVVQAEAEDFLHQALAADLLFLDPARRDAAGRKVAALSDCSPDVAALWPLLCEKSRRVMVKLSPMLDISDTLRRLPDIAEIHIIGSGGECKELLAVSRERAEGSESSLSSDIPNEPFIYCHDTSFDFAFLRSEELAAKPEYTDGLGQYLYDPAPVVLKASALRLCATRYGLRKLAPQTHLYTSDTLHPDFPGRIFRILGAGGCGKRDVSSLKGVRANLAIRNFPATAEALRHKWGLSDGGDLFLFVCQTAVRKILIKAEKVAVNCNLALVQPSSN